MELGSLFDGSGGFPLAASMCGIEPVWASEIEPYPIAVTRSRFPNMLHLGDITKIHGDEIPPVDIITFGSPCQDLSVAGKRAGLKHESNGDNETTRSGLFMDAVRIIKEMRKATNGRYPAYALWENVMGAFSSNKGEDFRIVLEELIKIVEPSAVMPEVPKNGWPYADSYIGDGWSLAYRVFDAQYWGVPQRRRRIHLILDLRGKCARKILFEREGLSGYSAEGFRSRQRTAGDVENGINTADGAKCYGISSYNSNAMLSDNPHSGIYEANTSKTLDVNGGNPSCNQGGICVVENIPCVLKTIDQPAVAYSVENHPADSRVDIDESGKVQTLTSRMGTGGGNVPMVMEQKIYCLDRAFYNQGQNAQYDPQLYTDGTCPTLVAKGPSAVCHQQERRFVVRRLTPTECARLQGFPDTWGHPDKKDDLTKEEYKFWLEVRNTHASINGKKVQEYTKQQMLTWYNKLHTDSAEYKMWGNGIALPPALYCMEGIKYENND